MPGFESEKRSRRAHPCVRNPVSAREIKLEQKKRSASIAPNRKPMLGRGGGNWLGGNHHQKNFAVVLGEGLGGIRTQSFAKNLYILSFQPLAGATGIKGEGRVL